MDSYSRSAILAMMLGLAASSWVACSNGHGGSPAEKLLRELGSPTAGQGVIEQLSRMSKSDPRARQYLSERVPPLIEEGPSSHSELWGNAVKLAGELKMGEAAPALSKWLSMDTGGGFYSLGLEERLERCAPGKALYEIGDPAIPAIQEVLVHGSLKERWRAYLVLGNIGSPRALAALRERLPDEQEEGLRSYIQRILEVSADAAHPSL